MFRWHRFLLLLIAALAVVRPAPTGAQSAPGSLAVKVTDADSRRPLEGARVSIVGTTIGGVTNGEGNVVLRGIPAGERSVRILRFGYAEVTRRVTLAGGQTASLEVAMSSVAVNLAPVVSTASGEQRRVELGNATANIDVAKVVEAAPIGNVNDLLNSRAPNVMVTSGTQTGTGARIRIRGVNSVSLNNDPIWIIDGVRLTNNSGSFSTVTGNGASGNTGGNNPSRLGDLNPDEIENIEVVKGPSAATLYGTDAANGVIVVTTKRGRAGAPRWSIYTELGSVYDRNTYPTAYTTWCTAPGSTTSARGGTCNLQRVGAGLTRYDSTTSLNIFEQPDLTPLATGSRQQLGAQLSGGTETLRYFFGVEQENEIGVLSLPKFERQRMDSAGIPIYPWTSRPNTMGRASLRLNLNSAVTPKLDVGVTTNFINVNQRYSLESNSTAGLGSHVFGGPGLRNNGTVSGLGTPLNGYRGWTPGYMWQEKTAQEVNRFLWSVNANYRPFTWLQNRLAIGQDWTGRDDQNRLLNGEGPPLAATTRLGSRGIGRVYISNFTVDLGSTAQFALLGFDWATTVGVQYVNYNFSSSSTGSNQLAPGSQNVGSGTQLSVGEGTTFTRTLGAFVEQTLKWRDRLFLTAAVRSDQNSAFGSDFQNVVYPKFSASYLISEEEWWKAPSWVNSMRLRYAYGQSGVQPGPNDALRFYSAGIASIQNADQPIIIQAALGNPGLRPEISAEHEGGFEMQLFNRRLSLDATYYSKITTDALIEAVQPPSFGSVSTLLTNIGSVKNAGVELIVTGQLVESDALGWDITLAASSNDNKVVSLGGVPPQIGTTSRVQVGYPISAYFARPITGWEDKNGDGLITYFDDASKNEIFVGDSAIFRGYATPRYMATLTNGFDLFGRKLRVQSLWDYRGGNRWYNNTERIRCTRPNCSGRMNRNATLEDQAMNVAANEHPARTLDGYIQPGAFVRLREVSAQWTFSPELARSIARARSMNVVLSGRNLQLWTKYRGVDPESGFNTTGGTEAPNEFQTVGPPSYFILRVNLGY